MFTTARLPRAATMVNKHDHDPFLRLLLLLGFVTSATAAEPLRVMSFNVRYATAADGDNAWTKRTDLFSRPSPPTRPTSSGFKKSSPSNTTRSLPA